MDLSPTSNPLLFPEDAKTVDLGELEGKTLLTRPRQPGKRLILDLRRKKTAAEAIAGLTIDNEIFGFTKGQFSVLDLIVACLKRTGPAHFSISTWTAARKEILEIDRLMKEGAITAARWLVDYTFVRRDKTAAHQVRKTFGHDAIRIANTHSKFCLFQNMNPRFEDFTLAHDPEIAAFLTGILDEIWAKQKRSLFDEHKTRGDEEREFRDEM